MNLVRAFRLPILASFAIVSLVSSAWAEDNATAPKHPIAERCRADPEKCQQAKEKWQAWCKENSERCEEIKQQRKEIREECKKDPQACAEKRKALREKLEQLRNENGSNSESTGARRSN